MQSQLGTHALLYDTHTYIHNEKLWIVNYASEIMSIGTEQTTTHFPQSSVVEIGRRRLLDYLWSVSVFDCAVCASSVEACLCLQGCYSGSQVHGLTEAASKHRFYMNVINLWISVSDILLL